MNPFPIGVFDSGAGGLSVLLACRALLPSEDFIYLADTKNAPYGNKKDAEILARVNVCCERLISLNCKAIVVACNTATGVGIKTLRERYARPFVGLEPAIKPAIEAGIAGEIVLLCTEATARQEKLLKLLSQFQIRHPSSTVTVAPQKNLAALIESHFADLESIRPQVHDILQTHKTAVAVVLGCTHYVFIREMIADFFRLHGCENPIFDGNAGAARRLKSLLKQGGLLTGKKTAGSVQLIFG